MNGLHHYTVVPRVIVMWIGADHIVIDFTSKVVGMIVEGAVGILL